MATVSTCHLVALTLWMVFTRSKSGYRIHSRNNLKDCARHHPIRHWILWRSGAIRVELEASSGYLPALTGVLNILRNAVLYCLIWLKISLLLIYGMNASDYHYWNGFHYRMI